MNVTEKGLGLDKDELGALLAFAHKGDDEHEHLAVVLFTIRGDRAWAYATDGYRALEGDGESDASHHDGEWIVVREFLEEGHRLLAPEQILRLAFAGSSLNHAIVEDKDRIEVSSLQWPREAAPKQTSFPGIGHRITLPIHLTRIACFTVNTDYLADLKKVAKAAGGRRGVDLYPPQEPTGHFHFRCTGNPTTTWTGVIMPMEARGAEPEEDGDDGDGPLQQSIVELHKALEDHDVTLTVKNVQIGESVEVKPRGKKKK